MEADLVTHQDPYFRGIRIENEINFSNIISYNSAYRAWILDLSLYLSPLTDIYMWKAWNMLWYFCYFPKYHQLYKVFLLISLIYESERFSFKIRITFYSDYNCTKYFFVLSLLAPPSALIWFLDYTYLCEYGYLFTNNDDSLQKLTYRSNWIFLRAQYAINIFNCWNLL